MRKASAWSMDKCEVLHFGGIERLTCRAISSSAELSVGNTSGRPSDVQVKSSRRDEMRCDAA